eukprot:CAMPEP_0205809066 /NCGR_PEP_ID=MMETSP0205-20121125/13182_1 /ASSEMBLY_ACC=CAM_ASM_000278 /TAXON_ID=36767 /ORGANISM="Euplotes focardii, Strain TN1" /LENGTH=234 /DNA_ID=CAMNT_0053085697 /DNA_START=522 /DNA_END=1222 /DNA_ORIENTATION=-
MEENKEEVKVDDESFRDLGERLIMLTHFDDLSYLYTPSVIALAAFQMVYLSLFEHELCKNENLVKYFKEAGVLTPDFWEKKNTQSMNEIYVIKVRKILEGKLERASSEGLGFSDKIKNAKLPDVSSIKSYKKYVRGVHNLLPNYLKDKEKDRKAKEIIPIDFLSDDEKVEEGMNGFKPPKPIKQKSKRISHKADEIPSAPLPVAPNQDVEMVSDTIKVELKDQNDDMIISLDLG